MKGADNVWVITGARLSGDSVWLRQALKYLRDTADDMFAEPVKDVAWHQRFRRIGFAYHTAAEALVTLGYPDPRPRE